MSEFNEPWKIEQRIDSDNDPYSVIVMSDGRDAIDAREYGGDCCDCSARIDMAESDLIRIAACVNFCRNLPTEWLQQHVATEVEEHYWSADGFDGAVEGLGFERRDDSRKDAK